MPPLIQQETGKQIIEMDDGTLRENLSQQQLVTDVQVDIRESSTAKYSRTQVISVVILCYVNLINYMDRYTVAGMLIDIGETFNLTASQSGLLQTAFILVYMVMAPIYGYLGDRFCRRYLLAVGVTLWSLMTLLGSFMPTYGSFLALRCLVGVGEASYSTIAPTLISDMFVKDRRSKMLALFYFAIPVGSGLGYITGAEVAELAKIFLPDDKDGEAWRWGLRLTPFLGFIAVILILFVLVEPPRGEVEGGQHLKATSFFSDLRDLFTNASYVLSTIAFTCVTYVAGALAWWGPNYVELGVRVQDDPNIKESNVAFVFGVIAMLAGLIGVPLGSWVGRKLRVKYPAADPLVCGVGILISIPLIVGGIILAEFNTIGAFVVVFFGQIFLNLNWAVVSDIVLYVVVPTRRASAEAFQILFSHAFGDAGSPYIVGVVTEAFKPLVEKNVNATLSDVYEEHTGTTLYTTSTVTPSSDDDYVEFKALQYSLILCTLVQFLGALFFIWNACYIRADKERCDQIIADNAFPLGDKKPSMDISLKFQEFGNGTEPLDGGSYKM